ncbi:TonB-dependent receptor-like protein [Lutibacter sp. Hel_I_33_5]|uniref:TonB-dependent receptor n=1 Tax=Lutibacter sp. Hel_I_33_5 TaxID=1566289 RepID=UPI0011A3CD90|nr:TonB-dependent receptor [Lutibacter sp. Hel_I_33_5]TVZ56706.1 TonB-dependent receptor-like protein [Lutibacter sp. Hel_I_33_5]
MKKFICAIILCFCVHFNHYAQNIVKGIVIDSQTENPLVEVSIEISTIKKKTSENGAFSISNLPNGNYILNIFLRGYDKNSFPIELTGQTIDLGTILLYKNSTEELDLSTITLTDDELNDDSVNADNITGLLQYSKDVFLRTAAFEWSSSFFSIRGLDSENGKVLINGIDMNKAYNGRPQWSNWGGLNDVFRNQEFNNGFTPSAYTFGGVLGSTNITVRASEQNAGTRISYASSNRSYVHRVMATYSSSLSRNGWAYTFSASRRAGKEGFVDGTMYNANSFFASVEKKLNDKHSLNFTSITAFNRRGKSAPNTQEVFDLKGIKYNSYWGLQDGKIRNSRIKEVSEPILMLNHYWTLNDKTVINTNISYQFGKIGNTRIDYNGGRNPDPVYYQNLPSYWLDRNNIQQAYESEKRFLSDGQLNWNELYSANINSTSNGGSNAFVLYEDRNDDKLFTINTILDKEINDNITVNAKLQYSKLSSHNFANVIDLLGGDGYLDINRFANIGEDARQNNLLNPNKLAAVGDTFKYNYSIESTLINAFAQVQFKYNKIDFYVAGEVSKASHLRNGLFQNGRFSTNSLGKSPKQGFMNFGFKAGATYKITGRHLVDLNAGYIKKAPTIRTIFSNPRENNAVINGLESEKIMSVDASYIFRSSIIQAKATGYFTKIVDATNIGFFFTQGAFTEAFVQEVTTGIDKLHFGAEIGIEAQVTSAIKLKGAANIGQYTYDSNPNIYVTSEDFITDVNPLGINDLGKSFLKDYKIAAGPQKTYSFGFEYRDPNYWWFGATANYLDDIYLNVSPISRSEAFYKDVDGLPFNNYDSGIAKELLEQEQFDGYLTINIIGGKSWKVGNQKYIGLFASVGNLLNQQFKTGGFEQSRRSDYQQLVEEKNRSKRLFGPKYWYGRGTTYFLNINYRF